MATPKIRSVFLERANTKSPAFKAWFRRSVVVDDQGQPLVVYHGTMKDFDVFRQANDIGHHFGSQDAANDRISFWQRTKETENMPGGNVMPVYLSIQNPIELDDMKVWEPEAIAQELLDRRVFTRDEYESIAVRDRSFGMQLLVKYLKKHGYDGISYINDVEGKGSISWIAFDPGQIKSVNNKGTWDRKRGSIVEELPDP